MKPHELAPAIRRNGLQPVYLLLGEEAYLRDYALQEIRKAVFENGSPDETSSGEGTRLEEELPGGEVLYGDETDASEIESRLREVPIFSPRAFVVLKWGDKLSAKQGERLIPYVKNPSDSATLVFMAVKLDGRQKWVQALKGHAVVVDCAPLFENQRLPWIKQEASRMGVHLSPEAAHLLKESAVDGLGIVRQELDKLVCYVPKGSPVGPEQVEAVRGLEPGASVFDLAEAIGTKNVGQALSILSKNLDAGEAPLRILGSLVWQYRRILKAKEGLAQKLPLGKIGPTLGIPPFRQQEFFSLVERFSEPHLYEAFQLFARTDSSLKGGSAGSPAQIMERLILALCGYPTTSTV